MKSSRTHLAGFIAICCLLSTGACSKKSHDVVGTWVPSGMPKGIEMSLELKPDRTWSQSIKDGKNTMSASGTYVEEKDSLNLTELKTAVDDVSKDSTKNYKYSYKVKWVTEDEIVLTQQDNPTTFKRKK